MDRKTKGRTLLPLCGLAGCMLLAAFSPAQAVFDRVEPTVSAFSKTAGTGQVLTFSPADFAAENGELSGIVIRSLPTAGTLTRGGEALRPGDVIGAESLGSLAFLPNEEEGEIHTSFEFQPVFAGSGAAEESVSASINLTDVPNSAPIAKNAVCETYCGLPLAGSLRGTDPDGDALTYELVGAPTLGTVTLTEDRFLYTPASNKAGTDAFTFVAVDPNGQRSVPAAVTIECHAREDGFAYADMTEDPNHYAALRLAELGILKGEQIGSSHFLYPNTPVSRAQFVAMAARICELPVPTAAVSTGMADNSDVPVWARATMAAALQNDLIRGEKMANGNAVIRATDPVTHAEAAVILDRMLCLNDDGRQTDYAGAVPDWAAQAVVNTVEAGYLTLDGAGTFASSAPLTRSETAACLYRAYKAMHTEEKPFWDIF